MSNKIFPDFRRRGTIARMELDDIADEIICVLPEGLELTEERWAAIVAEFRRRKAAGDRAMLDEGDVARLFSREARSS